MKSRGLILLLLLLCLSLSVGHTDEGKISTALPGFRMEEIETDLKVGYAVLLVDVNGDGKKDIVVVDTTRVVWYENPTWKRRTIIEGLTKPDNVCIAAYDIDGDGQLDLRPRRRLEAVQHQGRRHAPVAETRQDARRSLDRPPHRRRADGPSYPLRRPRRRRQAGAGRRAAHGPQQLRSRRTGWTAHPCAARLSRSRTTRLRTAGCRKSSTRACTSFTTSGPFPRRMAKAWTS